MHKFPANTLFTAKQFVNVPYCHSTNAYCATLLAEGKLFEGAIVITPKQLAGKGQRGNVWESAHFKNLTFSWLLMPTFFHLSQQFWLNAVISLGILDFLENYIQHGIKIKWPNDIYFYDEKLAGILIENTVKGKTLESSIVGIGLNVNQTEFVNPKATSMHSICSQPFDLNELLKVMLPCLEKRYLQFKKEGIENIQRDYLKALYWKDKEHTFLSKSLFKGVIEGVDESGKLLIQVDSEKKRFGLKEISFIE